jgi:hypothetical protein
VGRAAVYEAAVVAENAGGGTLYYIIFLKILNSSPSQPSHLYGLHKPLRKQMRH